MGIFQDHINFYKLARVRLKSHQNYVKFESFQAGIVIKFLKNKGISFKGKKVLDLGCGKGGYSLNLFKEGAITTSLDITTEYFQNIKGTRFILGNATRMPFKSNSFDFVFCSSLIEHIKNPDLLLREIKRVLKKNGLCYLSFPPFWSPVGAHQFKPFHYLGEKIAVRLSRKFYGTRSFRYDDVYGKLYKVKINQIKKIILKEKLKIKFISTRMSLINFAKMPILKDFLTWNAEFLVEK
jgi:ubiquinone/menaquinone biosynthesis C-methylase UbiE|tara:strand:- start:185 stop:898 length:714 start_codon:yes stop_codon:yes gene_type:complete